MPPPVAPKEEVVGSPGIPAAVSERPPRKGPITRYFMPLNSGSPSFFSSLSSLIEGADAAGAPFCAVSHLRLRSFCWEKVSVAGNRVSKASKATRTCIFWIVNWIMNSMAPGKELAVAHGKGRRAKAQTDAPSEFRATSTALLSIARYSGRGQKRSRTSSLQLRIAHDRFPYSRTSHRSRTLAQRQTPGHAQPQRSSPLLFQRCRRRT